MLDKKTLRYIVIAFSIGTLCGYLLGYFFPLNRLLKENENSYIIASKEDNCKSEKDKDDGKSSVETCDVYVEIAGAVNYPGVYCFAENSIVNDAVKIAGGLNKLSAKRYISQKINLAQRINGNQKIYIPFEDDLKCEEVKFTLDNQLDRYLNNGDQDSVDEKDCIDLNFATEKELDSLPGVGSVTAVKIIENRPYKSISDLKDNAVVSEKTFEQIEELLCL